METADKDARHLQDGRGETALPTAEAAVQVATGQGAEVHQCKTVIGVVVITLLMCASSEEHSVMSVGKEDT